MSEERKRRKAARERAQAPRAPVNPKIVIALAIIAVLAAVFYVRYHRHAHKYDAFAKCLAQKQLKMYGAYWCPHCQDQKEKFSEAFKYVPYVECGIPGNPRGGETQECKDAGVRHFPTWKFPDGDVQERVFSVDELSQKSGCPLP
jgi:hypothetical protein